MAEINNTDNTERFEQVARMLTDMYRNKNHDYGNSFGTIADEMKEKLGDNARMGYMVGHLKEKVTRIITVASSGTQVNESINDSLIDLASYAIMTYMELNK